MNDDTDRPLSDPHEPSTRDLILQVLERLGRVESAIGLGEADTLPLSGRINRLIADLAEFKAEMTEFKAEMIEFKAEMIEFKTETLERLEDMERDMARLSRQDAGRWLRLDDRIRALEHPEQAKQ